MGLRPTSNHEDPDFPLPLSSTTCVFNNLRRAFNGAAGFRPVQSRLVFH
jgi:hypothetical protein